MTAEPMEQTEVENGPSEAMDVEGSSSSSSSGTEDEKGEKGREMAEDSDEDHEDKVANPVFSKFMQGFWDLASVDVPVRVGAAAMIVKHVESNADGDAAYAVKRLVRGMCSSRKSARQGFASCLVQVLSALPNDAPTTPAVLEQIMKATQATVAMKGADDRELVLGRLLGVSALAMSGRLGSEPESAEAALKAVADLFSKRKWLAQAAGETVLLVTSKAFEGDGAFANVVLPLLTPLLKGKDGSTLQVSDLSPDQLLLSLGLRYIMRDRGLDPQQDAALKQALPPFLRHASVVRLGKAQDLLPALKQSSSSFPKVHSVWGRLWDDLGLSPAGQPRSSLSVKRLKKLGEVWSVVVDGVLTNSSLNNKGTAMVLFKQIIQRVPAAGVWHVLSPGIVRLMLNHTQGEENYLYSLVRLMLEQLPSLVQDDQEVQGQVATCLLRRGTIRFDNRAKVDVVSSLVKQMGQEALGAHVECLKGVLQGKSGWADSQANGDGPKTGTESTPSGIVETPAETEEGLGAERLLAVEALYSLARSGAGSVEGRGEDGRKAALAAAACGGIQAHGVRLTKTAEFFLETGFFAPADGAPPLPVKLAKLCRSKFFSLVADIAAKPMFWSNTAVSTTSDSAMDTTSPSRKASKKAHKKAPSGPAPSGGSWAALEALWGLHEAWQALEGGDRKLVEGVSVGLDEKEACSVALGVVGRIRAGAGVAGGGDKLGAAFAGILLMVSLHLLDGSSDGGRGEERCQNLMDLVETYGRMSTSGTGDKKEDGDDDDEDDNSDDPDPLAMLADVLVAVVAEPSSHSVRGLRDTARRVWTMVCGARPLTKSAVDTLLAAVCGEDDEANDEQGGNESSEEEEDDDDDDDDDDEEAKGNGGHSSDSSDDDDDEGNSPNDDDEVMVDPSDLEGLLGGNDGSDGEGLQHHAGADAALQALIGLKKSGRKKGTLEAQRQGFQIRLRALDLLEVVCSRRPNSRYLLLSLVPIAKAIRTLDGATSVGQRAVGEALALSRRLEALYIGRLCKCKPRVFDEEALTAGGDGEDAQDFPSETTKSFSELMGLCQAWEKDAPRASLALEGALCCLRSLQNRRPSKGSSGKGAGKEANDEALDGALAALSAAVSRFFGTKRKAGFNSKQVEEVVRAFPAVLVPVLVKAANGAAASDYLRTEAFRLMSDILTRRGQLEPVSRREILEHCPAIFKDLVDVLSATAAEAAAAAEAEAAAVATTAAVASAADAEDAGNKNKDAASKTARMAASSAMLKAKRLKRLLGCLTATIKADEGVGSLLGLKTEAQAMRAALEKVGEASASLAMQRLCGDVAGELDVIEAGSAGGKGDADEKGAEHKKKKKKQRGGDDKAFPKASPKPKREAPTAGGDAEDVGGVKGDAEGKTSSKKKRRRESKAE